MGIWNKNNHSTTARKKPAKKAEVKKEEILKAEEIKAKEAEVEKIVPPPAPAPSGAELTPEVIVPKEVAAPRPRMKKPPKGLRYYGTGRRKEAVARVWIQPGNGNIILNGKSLSEYFCGRKFLEYQITRPLTVTNTQGNYDVYAEIYGGGIPGQAGAGSLGVARALLEVSPDFRVKLKREGFLRRDPRMKERKKYGRKRARKSFQYTKR